MQRQIIKSGKEQNYGIDNCSSTGTDGRGLRPLRPDNGTERGAPRLRRHNRSLIAAASGNTLNVTLKGRTLWKDGDWNTLCLPFSIDDFSGTPLEGATVMELDVDGTYNGHKTGLDGSTLHLYFQTTESIKAGKPYVVKWASGTNIESPVFNGVTVDADKADVTFPGGAFRGTYQSIPFDSEDQSVLFLGANNTLYFPKSGATIGAQRAYFLLEDGADVREFKLTFGDETTGVSASLVNSEERIVNSEEWFSLDGRKLSTKPTKKGMYIVNELERSSRW